MTSGAAHPDPARVHHDADLDPELTAAVGTAGLDARRVDDAQRAQVDPWLDAVTRGFLDAERTDVQRQAFFERTAQRRKIGVYDAGAPHPEVPVATIASWRTELTVPGGVVPACAISSVTVAPTHRRRGLLRAMLVGELRTAAAQGMPVAVLTVTESGIYPRFGFAPAAHAARWKVAVRRAGWTGRAAPGRIDFITREHAREILPALHDRARLNSPGEIQMPDGHWDRFLGTRPDADKAGARRVVQYRSPAGDVEGAAIYTATENHADHADSRVDVALLVATTDDAYAALWRFLLSLDLIGVLEAGELSVDEPLWWMLENKRAAEITVTDHQYLRILDVPAALSARRYDHADTIALEVDDPLGFAQGRYLLTIGEDGCGHAASLDAPAPDGAAVVRLGVAELSALLLGGASAVTLARAGRLHTEHPERIARVFATPSPPRLSYWY